MTEEKRAKRRGWVKNAAIIFLSILLVLTFASNTIMNRSLPEVSAQYPTSGTITAKVRGSGAVEANQAYEVSISQTRTIQSVPVRVGDAVNEGDTLFVLEDSEGEELKAARDTLEQMELDYQKALIGASQFDYVQEDVNIRRAREDLDKAIAERDALDVSDEALNAAKANVTSAEGGVAVLEAEVEEIVQQISELGTGAGAGEALAELNEKLTAKQAALSAAQDLLKAYRDRLAELETNKVSYDAAAEAVISKQRALEDMIQALAEQKRGDSVTSQLENLNLEKQRKDINEQRGLVAKLQSEAIGAVVRAAQGGVISSINVAAGNTAQAESVLAVIELTDGGYSLSFTVTAEQSQKVSVGDVAEVTTFRWGADIIATLSAIKNDPVSAGKNKILEFTLTGDVTVGEQLSLSVGQKSANYETIVPNSAVRNDTNGDFILIVESRSSPLYTRRVAVRVDVTVLAKDDTSSAVSGALTSWDFVITTSSAPLEPGMLVRLAES